MDENTLQQMQKDIKALRQKLDIYASNLEKLDPKLASKLISQGQPNQFLGNMSNEAMLATVKEHYKNYDKQIVANIFQEIDRDPLRRMTDKAREYITSRDRVKEIVKIFAENDTPLDIQEIKREVGNTD